MTVWHNIDQMYNELLETDGFTFITNKNVLLKNENYPTYGRYSVGNIEGDFWTMKFYNNDELLSSLKYGINAIMAYFDLIEEEHPLLCPLNPTFGGWIREGRELVIDPVSVYRDLKTAKIFANMYNQEAIFDFKIMEEIFLSSL